MTNPTEEKTYHIRNSEKCYRFKPDAFCSHAPPNKGIYELVTFDSNQQPQVLFVGAAFEEGILACLEKHATGENSPSGPELLKQYPNLYFDYLTEMDAKTLQDAQDIYWWLIQKHKPVFNKLDKIQHSGRYANIHVIEKDS